MVDKKYVKYEKMKEIKIIDPEELKKILKYLESMGLKKGVDFDVVIFPNGFIDIFIGDMKGEKENA